MASSGRYGGHMVVKLLLANLWVCLSVWDWGLCQAYDFGYHPSAEEFDSLWHRELLANDRRRMEQRFVPRYQHAETSIRFEPPELDFQLFSQEEDADEQQPYVFESVEEAPTNTQPAPDLMHVQSQLLEIKDPTPQRPFANHHRPANGSSAQASFPIFFTNPATGIVYAISQVGEGGQGVQGSQPRNDSGGAIAIYVTKAQYDADIQALRQHYEEQCQQQQQQQQQQTIPPGTVLSTPNLKPSPQQGGVTARPQIIRLQKPKKRPGGVTNKLPKPQHRPPPVMVTSGPITTINDQVFKIHHKSSSTTTTRRPKTSTTRRKKRKKKKPSPVKVIKRRPGHKRRSNSTTERPAGPPPIILGTRPSSSSSSTTTTTTTRPPPGSTQLEKPHMPQATTSTGNIFSQHAYVINQGYHPQHPHSHVRRRRGLEAAAAGVGEGAVEGAGGSSAAVGRGAVVRGSTVEIPLIKGVAVGGSAAERSAVKVLPIRGSPTKGSSVVRAKGGEAVGLGGSVGRGSAAATAATAAKGSSSAVEKKALVRGSTVKGPLKAAVQRAATRSSSTVVRGGSSGARRRGGGSGSPRPRGPKGSSKSKSKPKPRTTPEVGGDRAAGGAGVATGVLHLPHAVHLLHRNHSTDSKENHHSQPDQIKIQPKKKKKSKVKAKEKERRRGRPEGSNFDIFELISGGDYDDDTEEDDEYYYEDENENGVGDEKEPQTGQATSSSSPEDPKEDSSSAEEGADFGAMEESETTTLSPTSTELLEGNQFSSTKNSMAKKRIRIRRRPPAPSSSEEDDNDDDSGGIGGFFRMIFYPVQVAMSRLMDLGFGGPSSSNDEDEEEVHKVNPTKPPKYPSYTLYHSAHSNEAYAQPEDDEDEGDDDDDYDGSSTLGSWFSSWFGPGRRTKKIGSTTTVVPLPAPTQEPAGWLDSWFGFGKTTTTTPTDSDEDDYDKWFSSWFDAKPKRKVRRRSTTSTTTTSTTTSQPSAAAAAAAAAQVPILTIVDPLRNPQNWIGILAHHIVNSTGNAMTTRMTTKGTTTVKPDIPRRISYDKYQIWRLKPQDEAQVRALEEFKKGEDGVKMHWLKGPSLRGLTDVLVPPKMLVDFQGTLNYESIAHEVLIFDVGMAIAYEQSKEDYLHTTPVSLQRPSRPKPKPTAVAKPGMTWNRYHTHDEIVQYLETMRMRHPQLVELIHIGRSYEGRPLIVVKIESKQSALAANASASGYKRPKRKRKSGQANAVFVEAGAHGLAWIGPATATWMISELLRLMKTNKSNEELELIRNTTWYIMPVLNPDGYAYSHEYDRFWKKSRSQHMARAPGGLLDSAMTWLQQKRDPDKVCHGVDLDRNWLYHWGKRGSSKAPCNEFYAGPAPFSEPETKAVSDFLMDQRTQIKLYISLQAYGQVVSYPVKANSTFNSELLDDFLDVAMVGTDGLRKKGSKSRYKVDASNDLIEQRSGCADAFAAYEIGIPFSYTIQLADNGVHGYLLPSSAIEPTARDAFEIVSGMLDYI
ncbi:uncharacterized protein [Drosophila pseudoobscura]|uniref:Peptidase M14 domain-containing protein n=1 Tax=Drosophila pseudoobscura pseudoobscura TaxID=46245 RepID=A0A6I8UFB4_DROPS|nr:uncharacterized protein LOC4814908 [Drosophila pseudoobscura]